MDVDKCALGKSDTCDRFLNPAVECAGWNLHLAASPCAQGRLVMARVTHKLCTFELNEDLSHAA